MKFDNIVKKVPRKDLFAGKFAKPGIQPGFANMNRLNKHTNISKRVTAGVKF